MSKDRVATFIDNSNVFHHIKRIKRSDPKWASFYDPFVLANKLSGNREVAYVGFYCVPPPSYLLSEGGEKERKYKRTKKYYDTIRSQEGVEVRQGNLKGPKGDTHEKNLDTKISTDIVTKAALNEYDTAILVSNDGDYKSALKSISEEFGRRVEVAYFKGSLSMNFEQQCDLKRRLRRVYFQKIDLNE